jgi:hypothetical protein
VGRKGRQEEFQGEEQQKGAPAYSMNVEMGALKASRPRERRGQFSGFWQKTRVQVVHLAGPLGVLLMGSSATNLTSFAPALQLSFSLTLRPASPAAPQAASRSSPDGPVLFLPQAPSC